MSYLHASDTHEELSKLLDSLEDKIAQYKTLLSRAKEIDNQDSITQKSLEDLQEQGELAMSFAFELHAAYEEIADNVLVVSDKIEIIKDTACIYQMK